MKTNLSSQITLDRVSPRYYRPGGNIERSVLTRFEKLPTEIYASAEEAATEIALKIAQTIRKRQQEIRACTMAFSGGATLTEVFNQLIRMHEEEGLSFHNVVVFVTYEYYPLPPDATVSNLSTLKEQFFNRVDIPAQNIYPLDGSTPQERVNEHCMAYEKMIEQLGGIDIMLLGIGRMGNIAMNVTGSQRNSHTRLVLLDPTCRNEAVKVFGSEQNVPICAITMGISTIRQARKIFLIAWGEEKADVIKNAVEGEMTDAQSATFLQMHNNVQVVLDLSSAAHLTRIHRPWLVTSCDWTDKLIRSAIVWLCERTGKPILKLTNKDYNEHGLGELLAIYGSAYQVNIKIGRAHV